MVLSSALKWRCSQTVSSLFCLFFWFTYYSSSNEIKNPELRPWGAFQSAIIYNIQRNCDDFQTIWNSHRSKESTVARVEQFQLVHQNPDSPGPIAAGPLFLSCCDRSIFHPRVADNLLWAQGSRRSTWGQLKKPLFIIITLLFEFIPSWWMERQQLWRLGKVHLPENRGRRSSGNTCTNHTSDRRVSKRLEKIQQSLLHHWWKERRIQEELARCQEGVSNLECSG